MKKSTLTYSILLKPTLKKLVIFLFKSKSPEKIPKRNKGYLLEAFSPGGVFYVKEGNKHNAS